VEGHAEEGGEARCRTPVHLSPPVGGERQPGGEGRVEEAVLEVGQHREEAEGEERAKEEERPPSPAAGEEGQQAGVFRAELNAKVVAKILFGALDEMATNWILSKRRYKLAPMADQVLDIFLNGVSAK